MVKFPKPSNSPRDPLNFSFKRKAGALIVASLYAFVANFASSNIAPVLQLWPSRYPTEPKTFDQLSYIIAVGYLSPWSAASDGEQHADL